MKFAWETIAPYPEFRIAIPCVWVDAQHCWYNGTQASLASYKLQRCFFQIVEAVKYLNYFASIFFLTAMSIDRYIAVVYVVTSNKWRTSKNTFFVCCLFNIFNAP